MTDNIRIGELIVFLIGAGGVAFLLSLISSYARTLVQKRQWEKNGHDRRKNEDLTIESVSQKLDYLETKSEERFVKYIPMLDRHEARLITLEVQYKTIIEILNEIKQHLSKNGFH